MSTALVDRLSGVLARRSTSRRSFLAKTAVVGSAVVVTPVGFLMRPGTAYAAVCGPDSTCGEGYTVFCCTVNDGQNKCPPGTFVAGWWKSDASSYCCSGGARRPRYYIDCNATCTCGTETYRGSGLCSSSCVQCRAACYDGPDTCDRRRVCRNYFRYGQCHTEVALSGPVACRVVSCTPPYQLYGACGTRPLTDNQTANHTAPCLSPACA